MVTHVDGKKHVLEIKEVTLDDTCQIKAEAKGIPSMANLTVIGKPQITICLSSSSMSSFLFPTAVYTIRPCLCLSRSTK